MSFPKLKGFQINHEQIEVCKDFNSNRGSRSSLRIIIEESKSQKFLYELGNNIINIIILRLTCVDK